MALAEIDKIDGMFGKLDAIGSFTPTSRDFRLRALESADKTLARFERSAVHAFETSAVSATDKLATRTVGTSELGAAASFLKKIESLEMPGTAQLLGQLDPTEKLVGRHLMELSRTFEKFDQCVAGTALSHGGYGTGIISGVISGERRTSVGALQRRDGMRDAASRIDVLARVVCVACGTLLLEKDIVVDLLSRERPRELTLKVRPWCSDCLERHHSGNSRAEARTPGRPLLLHVIDGGGDGDGKPAGRGVLRSVPADANRDHEG